MNRTTENRDGILLQGLDGSNPLAFLAALGALRTLNQAWPERNVKMGWTEHSGAWRPVLRASSPELKDIDSDRDSIVNDLYHALAGNHNEEEQLFALGKNLSVSPSIFRRHVHNCAISSTQQNRRSVDYFSSFGSEVLTHNKLDRIAYTELCFISGSGHQHYLDTMKKLKEKVSAEHIHEALFERWRYQDERLSMRWDPIDAREHAYQWTAPGDETTTTVWGANILACEGTALYAVVPVRADTPTTGFMRINRRLHFTWPMWRGSLSVDIVRSLIASPEISCESPNLRTLHEMGIDAVFRSEKLKIGEGVNFKWSFGAPDVI